MSTAELTRDWGAHTTAPGTFVDEVQVTANVTALTLAKGRVVAGLGDGRVVALAKGALTECARHEGAVTGIVASETQILSTAQDGRLLQISPETQCLKQADGWITALSLQGNRAAVAIGKVVHAFHDGVLLARFDAHASTVTGLALSPQGDRLAVSHYNGVTIWTLDELATPMRLTWAGSLISVSWSPDGRFIAAGTQDRELHVWDLVTERDYRLGGYLIKAKQIGWTENSGHLYSTGADVVAAWALAGGEPNALPPVEIGYAFGATITAVIPIAAADAVLAGYSDGSLILGETTKGTAKILRGGTGAPVTVVALEGRMGAFGTADGTVGTVRI